MTDWKVLRTGNPDVEREHLNRILKEIREAIESLGGGTVASTPSLTTSDVPEGSRLYYTDARATSAAEDAIGAASIGDLSDVDTTTAPPTDGQALVWDTDHWEPGTVSGGGGGSGDDTLTWLGV